jgi:hypothetical protein
VLRYQAASTASPARAWSLLARPERWHEWAPHVRGARGLGDPEVRAGARGAAMLLGVLPVPARVTAKRDRRSWTWRVGPVEMDHRVQAHGQGSMVAIEIRAPGAVEAILRVNYGPVVAVLVRNLARAAEGRPAG